MDRDEFSRIVLDSIHAELKSQPGGLTRAERRLGLCEGYVRSAKRPGYRLGVKLGVLGGLLEEANLEPGLFFSQAFPEGTSPLDRFLGKANRIAQRIVEPKTLVVVRQKEVDGKLDQETTQVEMDEVHRANELRFDSPHQAGIRAASIAKRSHSRVVVARALGVWASTLRMAAQLDRAAVVLGTGLAIARVNRPIVADLVQRAAYLASDWTQFRLAADLAAHALVLHAFGGDTAGIGRTLVDSGTFLDRLGEHGHARDAYRAALHLLPEPELHNRWTALHALSWICIQTGDLQGARAFAGQAVQLAETLPVSEVAKIDWLLAWLARREGNFDTAIQHYQLAIGRLGSAPLNVALASSELVETYLESGNPEQAVVLAHKLTPIVMQLNNELAESALSRLILAARRGEITLSLASQVVRQIKEAGASSRKN